MTKSATRVSADKVTFTQTEVTSAITAGDTAARAGRKNWIINGDMQISQRGDYTSATSATDGLFYLDRWKAQVTNVTATIQDTTLSQKLVATSTASGNLEVLQKVEDFNILTNKTITVSAKITSNSSAARIAVLTASGTWHSSSAHTGGGNEETLSVTFSSGSATRMDVWIGITGSSRAAVSISSGNYVEITGVQLELGSVATDFEHRSFGEILADCQRYYQRTYNYGTATGTATTDGALLHSMDGTQSYGKLYWQFKTSMRSNPTIVSYNTNNGTVGQLSADSLNHATGFLLIGQSGAGIGVSGISIGTSTYLKVHATADAEL
tara:strand:- start:54 stop:1025 length:972 start_codon:yes stop_codon:yes gene_type:complete